MVRNGPDIHPGALSVNLLPLNDKTAARRRILAETLVKPPDGDREQAIVHRHLQTGDRLLVNRQPTLHKPSMMAHKARVSFF